MPTKILIVDDHVNLRNQFKFYLEKRHYAVETAADGYETLDRLETINPDIIVLDVELVPTGSNTNQPMIDGFDVCKAIRARPGYGLGEKGIIVISGVHIDLPDEIVAYRVGADIFRTKPIEPAILLAMIKSLEQKLALMPTPSSWLSVCDHIQLDLNTRQVKMAGQEIHLTPQEFDILTLLAQAPNTPHAPLDMAETLATTYDAIRKSIGTLRKKIEADPQRPSCIKTVHGIGYKLVK